MPCSTKLTMSGPQTKLPCRWSPPSPSPLARQQPPPSRRPRLPPPKPETGNPPGTIEGREPTQEAEAGPETPETPETEEAGTPPTRGPTEVPVTLTTHLQGHVDCIGSSGRLPGHVPTDTTARGGTTSPPDPETIGTSLPPLKQKIEK